MGQAKRRGTFEERRAQAILREQELEAAIEAKRKLRAEQEMEAYRIMTWWQLDMTEIRYQRAMRRETQIRMQAAALRGMLGGMGWNAMSALYAGR